jgi:hypothetical protein
MRYNLLRFAGIVAGVYAVHAVFVHALSWDSDRAWQCVVGLGISVQSVVVIYRRDLPIEIGDHHWMTLQGRDAVLTGVALLVLGLTALGQAVFAQN